MVLFHQDLLVIRWTRRSEQLYLLPMRICVCAPAARIERVARALAETGRVLRPRPEAYPAEIVA
jgi:hypothetical protein